MQTIIIMKGSNFTANDLLCRIPTVDQLEQKYVLMPAKVYNSLSYCTYVNTSYVIFKSGDYRSRTVILFT